MISKTENTIMLLALGGIVVWCFTKLPGPTTQPPPVTTRRPTGGSASVIIYGASWCEACHKAAAYLTARKIPFVEHDIEKNLAAGAEMLAKLTRAGLVSDQIAIPVIDVRGRILIGFSPSILDAALAAS